MVGSIDRLDAMKRVFQRWRLLIDFKIFCDESWDSSQPAGDPHRADIGVSRKTLGKKLRIEFVGFAIDIEPGAREQCDEKWRANFNNTIK